MVVVVVYQRAWRKRSNAGFLWRGLDSNLRGINIIKGGKCMQEGGDEQGRGGEVEDKLADRYDLEDRRKDAAGDNGKNDCFGGALSCPSSTYTSRASSTYTSRAFSTPSTSPWLSGSG